MVEFDIIILTETFDISDCKDIFTLERHNVLYNEGKYNNNGVVVIYIKNKY